MQTTMRAKTRQPACLLVVCAQVVASFYLLAVIFGGCSDSVKSENPETPNSYTFNDRLAISYYYIWFTPGWWDGSDGNAGTALDDVHPELGEYSSADANVIDQHIRWAVQANLDALAVSWWYDSSAGGMNDKLADVYTAAQTHGMRIALLLEAEQMALKGVKENLEYFFAQYADHPATLRVDDNPVVVVWGTWNAQPDEWDSIFVELEQEGHSGFYVVSQQLSPRYLEAFRCLEQYVTVDVPDDSLEAFFQAQRSEVDVWNSAHPDRPAQWHASIMPGFDERNIPGRDTGPGGAGYTPRDNGAYYRRCFDAAMASNPDWLRITSFNELAEHTHIEPMQEFGTAYLDSTARFVEEFKGGR